VRILGLDVSSKTGYAVLEDGKLLEKGLAKSPAVEYDDREQDFGALARAEAMCEKIAKLIVKYKPDAIAIEQTNAGKFRTSQKLLEFTHCLILRWVNGQEMALKVRYIDTSKWRSGLGIKLTKEQRVHNKAVKAKAARGKVTPKHLAVAWANKEYGLDLLQKDHDIADAIACATLIHRRGLNPMKTEVADFNIEAILANPKENLASNKIVV